LQLVVVEASAEVAKFAQCELVAEVLLAPLTPMTTEVSHCGQFALVFPAANIDPSALNKLTAAKPVPGTVPEAGTLAAEKLPGGGEVAPNGLVEKIT
jgi:hypothetical protein